MAKSIGETASDLPSKSVAGEMRIIFDGKGGVRITHGRRSKSVSGHYVQKGKSVFVVLKGGLGKEEWTIHPETSQLYRFLIPRTSNQAFIYKRAD